MFVGTSKEKFFYHNTLLCLIKAMQGQKVTLDLLNDSCVCGTVELVDGYMNISFTNVVYCDPRGVEYSFQHLFIQSRNIRYIHIPETISMISAMKKELHKGRPEKETKKPTVKSRKAKKAYQQHMQIVASLKS